MRDWTKAWKGILLCNLQTARDWTKVSFKSQVSYSVTYRLKVNLTLSLTDSGRNRRKSKHGVVFYSVTYGLRERLDKSRLGQASYLLSYRLQERLDKSKLGQVSYFFTYRLQENLTKRKFGETFCSVTYKLRKKNSTSNAYRYILRCHLQTLVEN